MTIGIHNLGMLQHVTVQHFYAQNKSHDNITKIVAKGKDGNSSRCFAELFPYYYQENIVIVFWYLMCRYTELELG